MCRKLLGSRRWPRRPPQEEAVMLASSPTTASAQPAPSCRRPRPPPQSQAQPGASALSSGLARSRAPGLGRVEFHHGPSVADGDGGGAGLQPAVHGAEDGDEAADVPDGPSDAMARSPVSDHQRACLRAAVGFALVPPTEP